MLSGKLMGAGADQQLVATNLAKGMTIEGVMAVNNQEESGEKSAEATETEKKDDGTNLSIEHGVAMAIPEAKEEVKEEPKEDDAVKAAMSEVLNPMGANENAAGPTMVAGVEVSSVPTGDGYNGGALADQILNNINGENREGGETTEAEKKDEPSDYGKMIDEALAEPLPGEGGIQVGANGPTGPVVDTQDVDDVNPPEAQPEQQDGMSEQEAMNLIKQAQTESAIPGLPENGELPKIITGGGMSSLEEESKFGGENPAAMAAPEVGTVEPSVLPMPGQEITAPPVLPTPEFGTMPPSIETPNPTVMPDVNSVPQLPQMPQVQVQPDENMLNAAAQTSVQYGNEAVGMQTGAGNFQSNQQITENLNSDSTDPNAFKIPGIHT